MTYNQFGPTRSGKLSVAVIMTGGTIAKSYNPGNAKLYNFEAKVEDLIAELRTDDLDLSFVELMHKDSLEIGAAERALILEQIQLAADTHQSVVITHGTDTLPDTAQAVFKDLGTPSVPVIFTGAMVPYAIRGSDAQQNITEALLAARLLPAGIYIAFHNRILTVPNVRKNYQSMTFEGTSDGQVGN